MYGLKEVFIGEAEEILRNLEPDIVRLEEGGAGGAPEIINRIFRYIHTLKGSSGMAGLDDISKFTHRLENLMEGVRSGDLKVEAGLIDILLGSMDWIKLTIFGNDEGIDAGQMKEKLLKSIEEYKKSGNSGELRNEEDADPKERKKVIKRKADRKNSPGKNYNNTKGKYNGYKFYRVRTAFKESIFEYGIDPLIIIEDLISLGRLSIRKVVKSKLPYFEDMDPEKCYLNWDIIIRTKHTKEEIEDVFLFVEDNNQIKIEDVTTNYNITDNSESYKIGEIMLSENIITENELSSVLDTQKTEGKKIAEIILEKGYASQEDINYALEEQDKIRKRIESTTVRVATGKLDTLLNLLGEIVIGQSSISRAAEQIGGEEGERVKNAVYSMDRTTREFQEQIMAIRMIPVGPSFEQFVRFVRDTAKEYGKEIRLETDGSETELDKTVIEKINDPLKHMIRNAIDHGIESPKERLKAGKNRKGVIGLRAYHQEGNVYIEVSDDGRGIDKVKVRKKAEKIGLIKPSDEVTDEKLFKFLFLPGFSTAEKIGNLSGRGVGMDVVKSNIEQLRGTIKIETESGKGTRFILKLPLTLAIIDGMLVRVGRWRYIIPLTSIIESLQPDKNDIKTIEGSGEIVHVRESYISLLKLYDLFGIEPDSKDPWESLIVIVESNGVYLGLMVDELIGQQQIVIKNIDSGLTKSRAISGASILGDGTVSLIVDIHGLVGELAS